MTCRAARNIPDDIADSMPRIMTVAGSGGHSGRPNVPHSVIAGADTNNVICSVPSFDQSHDQSKASTLLATAFQFSRSVSTRELSHRCRTADPPSAVQSPCCAIIGKNDKQGDKRTNSYKAVQSM